ncbi:sigma factor [Sphingobium phenoxybenzoativorans]|nr:sigma factor [Sphingobium phenoxybenzoativorans]
MSAPLTTEAPPLSDRAFKDKMITVIPQLRAFARGLCGNRDTADDLVQEAMLKAWAARERFLPGTNFRAWTFTILRNLYFSQIRRGKFVGDWDDLVADRLLAAPASQEKTLELHDLIEQMLEEGTLEIPRESFEGSATAVSGIFAFLDQIQMRRSGMAPLVMA